jgi:hypothetical protein
MKVFYGLITLSLRTGIIATILIASNLGCISPNVYQSIYPTTDIYPSITRSSVPPVPSEPENSPVDDVWEMIGQVDINRAMNDLRKLTGEAPTCIEGECHTIQNRLTGSEGLQWAKEYVYSELGSLGYSIEIQNWSRNGQADQNLIVRKPGKVTPDEEIYFIAHLDGVSPAGAEHSPAADDDASGSVGLLELARVLSHYTFYRTIVLFFSTGEEQGANGARSYVDQLSQEELGAIKYVVDVEMLGYDANRDGAMEFWSGDHPPSLVFAQNLSEIVNAYQLDLAPKIVTGCT